MHIVAAPVARGKQNVTPAALQRQTHPPVERRAVGVLRLVAEIVFQKVRTVFGKGLCVQIFVAVGRRVVGTGAHTGAGIHAEFESLAVDIVRHGFHAVGEFDVVGNDLARHRVAFFFAPAVVDHEVFVSGGKQAFFHNRVGGFTDHLCVDVFSEGVPGVETHRRFFREHNGFLLIVRVG